MENRQRNLYEFIRILIKCFIILLFFGVVLPEVLNVLIFKLIDINKYHENSTFVNGIFYKNRLFGFKYMYIIRSFLSF